MIIKCAKTFLLTGFFLIGAFSIQACSVAFYSGETDEGTEVNLTGRTADLTSELFTVKDKINIYPRGLEHNGNNNTGTLTLPATWTSKYGSLIIDGFVDGFNEKGLCVHPLYLDGSEYPEPDESTPCVSIQKVTSYLLDNAATVDECLDLLDEVIVVSETFEGKPLPIHWAIRDASNNTAIIEFVNKGSKKRPKSDKVVYQGTVEEYDVLTNEPCLKKQLKYYKKFAKGRKGLPGDFNSLARFVRLKMFKKTLPVGTDEWGTVINIFSLMSTVHCVPGAEDYSGHETEDEWPTIWTVVTDMDNWKYYVKITDNPNIIWIDFKKFDFDTLTQTGTLGLDNRNLIGEVNSNIVWE